METNFPRCMKAGKTVDLSSWELADALLKETDDKETGERGYSEANRHLGFRCDRQNAGVKPMKTDRCSPHVSHGRHPGHSAHYAPDNISGSREVRNDQRNRR